ncbi:hypothetical protein LEP1GSC061_0035 [Leptospira wolffii serovar Khorat str. Khorat-H2]|nr:hypothetical protein LEP1GSC061_0035 [Leptospira wolffii serovar Khorat str. Khorat-H2]
MSVRTIFFIFRGLHSILSDHAILLESLPQQLFLRELLRVG